MLASPVTPTIVRARLNPLVCSPALGNRSAIARRDGAAVDDAPARDRADDEPGRVVFALGVQAGHLGRFAADQRPRSRGRPSPCRRPDHETSPFELPIAT